VHCISHKKKVKEIKAKSLNQLRMQLSHCPLPRTTFVVNCSVNQIVVLIVVFASYMYYSYIECYAGSDYSDASHDRLTTQIF